MWPLIREGIDTVEVRPAGSLLKKGDVILYRAADDKYVLHRIVGLEDDCYMTLGDNTVVPELVPKDRVAGIMTGLWRGERQVKLDSVQYRLYIILRLRLPFLFKIFKSTIWRQ